MDYYNVNSKITLLLILRERDTSASPAHFGICELEIRYTRDTSVYCAGLPQESRSMDISQWTSTTLAHLG